MADAQKHRAAEPSAFTEVTTRGAGTKAAANRPKRIAGASLVNPSAKKLVYQHTHACNNYPPPKIMYLIEGRKQRE